MSESKKQRQMSAKGWLKKATSKAGVSAEAFLLQHKEWLITGELAKVSIPILKRMEAKEILPTPAMKELQNAVLGHIIAMDTHKAEVAIEAATNPVKAAIKASWVASIYNSDDQLVSRINSKGDKEDLTMGFERDADGQRWADRRLFEAASDCYAEVVHVQTQLVVVIMRDDAIARILYKPKQGAMRVKGITTKTLGFGVKCHNDRSTFSKG